MKRRLWTSLIGVVLITLSTLVFNVATDNTPILGLDLQGGVSVILAPVEPATEQDLIIIRDLIRDELERRGIAEPDVRVQGQTIVVDLPGVRDQDEALSAVDVSGVVELRPVLNFSDCPAPEATQPALGLGDETPSTGSAPDTSVEPTGFRRPQAPPADSSRRHHPGRHVCQRTRCRTVPWSLRPRPPRRRSPERNCCRLATVRSSVSGRPRAPARSSRRAARSSRAIRDGASPSICAVTVRPPGTTSPASVTTLHRPARRHSPVCAVRSPSSSTASCSRRRR